MKWTLLALAAALALLAAAAASGVKNPVTKRALGYWNSRKRFALRLDEPPFAHLAASQVGYAPSMRKQFTARRKFASFRVVRDADGSTVFTGGAPEREVRTDILGGIETVFIGDFSAVAAPGRYRIVDDAGESSFPFDVGVNVFDPVVRAVQRWFYYQRAFTAVEPKYAEGPWVHGTDAAKAPPGVRMGWHDAG